MISISMLVLFQKSAYIWLLLTSIFHEACSLSKTRSRLIHDWINNNASISRVDESGNSNRICFDASIENGNSRRSICSRRIWLAKSTATTITNVGLFGIIPQAFADSGDSETYENPNIPAGPEERSGLVVLRVAEVCNFQEKILRAVVNGDIEAVVSPQQIVFGTQILLRNSNIAGNMKLMIDTEVPQKLRAKAARNAATIMNTLQKISTTASKIQRPFTNEEMLEIADLYLAVRVQLNSIYEFLPKGEKDKYYGYFMAVTDYEKKIAEGVYNPEIDGVLKFDD